jgi:hypothetical protein
MAARHKLWAKGLLEETKMILGWRWDFRHLIIFLPINKCTAWAEGMNEMIKNKKSDGKNTGDNNRETHSCLHDYTGSASFPQSAT